MCVCILSSGATSSSSATWGTDFGGKGSALALKECRQDCPQQGRASKGDFFVVFKYKKPLFPRAPGQDLHVCVGGPGAELPGQDCVWFCLA